MEELQQVRFYKEENKERYLDYRNCHVELPWEVIVSQVNIGLDRSFYSNIQSVENPDSYLVLVNKYNRLSADYIPRDLEVIDLCYNSGELLLRHDARIAFEEMCKDAGGEGIRLEAISTYRSFSYQEMVYFKNYIPGTDFESYQKIRDRVSARAGHSEHQTGLAVDINDLEQTFEDTVEGRWLAGNSWRYGFLLRYPKGTEWITGYDYEPWHFRYLGSEYAKEIYESGLTYDEYYMRYINQNSIDNPFLSAYN